MTTAFQAKQAVPSFEISRKCPLAPQYCVTESGRVSRIGSSIWLSPCVLKRGGYLAVSLRTAGKAKTWPVHQLVAVTFHGPRPSPDHHAAHNDGNKMNNHHSNIRWATRRENEADKIRHGRTNRGERNGMAKLNDSEAAAAKARVAAGECVKAVARSCGLTASGLRNIVRGKRRAN